MTTTDYNDSPEWRRTTNGLTEAFHVLYDVKDANPDARIDGIRDKAYAAIQAVKALMVSLNIDVPRRFDGDGRPEA